MLLPSAHRCKLLLGDIPKLAGGFRVLHSFRGLRHLAIFKVGACNRQHSFDSIVMPERYVDHIYQFLLELHSSRVLSHFPSDLSECGAFKVDTVCNRTALAV